jgi:tetratricopeptide (TPR) repeat protein
VKITCIKCQALYSIDDALLAGGPIKAQCPACGDIQVVKPPTAAGGQAVVTHNPTMPPADPEPKPGLPAEAGLPDMSDAKQAGGQQPPPLPRKPAPPQLDQSADPDLVGGPPPAVEADADDPFAALDLGGGAASPPPVGGGTPAEPADPFADLDQLGAPGQPPPGSPPPPAAAPAQPDAAQPPPASHDPLDQLELAGSGAADGQAQQDPFAGLETAGGGAEPSEPDPALTPGTDASRCDRCGGMIAGAKPADGLCERCRGLVAQPAEEGGGLQQEREWRVRKPDGVILGPLTLAEIKQKYQAGEVDARDQVARGENDFRLISSFPEFAVFFRRPGESLQPMYRTAPPSHFLRNTLIALVLLLAAAAGAVYYFWPQIDAWLAPEQSSASVVEDALASFSAEIPKPSGSSAEAVERARKLMLQDERLAYLEADRLFKTALILDPTNMDAYAGWVQNRALLDLGAGEVRQRKIALDLVDHALERAPDKPALLRAKAYLFYSLGRMEEARQLANKVLSFEEEDPEALLIMGATYLDASTSLAVDLFRRALEGNESLNLAYRMLGEAKIRLGKFREAMQFFKARLEQDPGQYASLDALARVYRAVGRFKAARRVYERILGGEPNRVEAAVALARIDVQVLNRRREALELLDGLLQSGREGLGEAARARLLAEKSVVLRLLNRLAKAEEAVEQALGLDPTLVPALYSRAWLALRSGELGKAIVRFRELRSHIPDVARVKLLIAEAEAQVPNYEAAQQQFQTAIEADPNDMDAFLMLAALQLNLDNPNQAYTWLRKATEVHPFHDRHHRRLTPYYDGADLLATAVERVEQGAVKYGDDPLAQALAGAVLWRAGKSQQAQGRLLRALSLDAESFAANLLLGALLLDEGRPHQALGYLRQAHRTNSLHEVGAVLLARAQLETRNAKPAEKLLTDVLREKPGYLPARLCLAEVQLARKKRKLAIQSLLKVYEGDKQNVRAKELLFQLGY